jgi:hypothetical protein
VPKLTPHLLSQVEPAPVVSPLLAYARDVTSQCGEDGILEHLFSVLPEGNRYCIEFGAWDGRAYSNTWNLLNHHGWQGCLIEGDPERYQALTAAYAGNDRVHCVHRFVATHGENRLEAILTRAGAPQNPDLLSIDVDGLDYFFWESLEGFHPRVVVIEFNPTVPNDVAFVQAQDPSVNQGCSLRALIALAARKGYELVCATAWNGIFVTRELYGLVGISDNRIDRLYRPMQDGRIFHGYDGTVHVTGMDRLCWTEHPRLTSADFQVLPDATRLYADRKDPSAAAETPAATTATVPELCILFAYHRLDALTLHHLALLRQHNPTHPIVPISADVPEHLPDGVDLSAFEDRWPAVDGWRRCDTMIYRWFLNRTVTAKRYVYVEYDCHCTQDLADVYREVWDADIAVRDVYRPGDDWPWFAELDRLEPEKRPYALGIAPLAGVLCSHDALERLIPKLTARDVFCELRFGTAAQEAGLTVSLFPEPLRTTLQWNPHGRLPTAPGLWHAIKQLEDPRPMPADENVALNRPAVQSSISEWSEPRSMDDARGGNNGRLDARYGFHTAKEQNPWWQVDLERLCAIDTVQLYNDAERASRLRQFQVMGSVDGLTWETLHRKTDDSVFGLNGAPYVMSLPEKPTVRFVRIVLEGVGYLHFCECEIRGQAESATP